MCEYNQFGQALGVALPDWRPHTPTDRYYRAAVVDSNR